MKTTFKPSGRPLLVGQEPNPDGNDNMPLCGLCGFRLAALFGMSYAQYIFQFDRRNLMSHYEAKWDKERARMCAANIMYYAFSELHPPFVILLGKKTAGAFDKGNGLDYFDSFEFAGIPFFVMPHPSGKSRWWNSLKNRKATRAFCRQIKKRFSL